MSSMVIVSYLNFFGTTDAQNRKLLRKKMRKYINYEQGEYNDLLYDEEHYHLHTG